MEPEALLEPDLEICDPHHHLWEYPESVYLVDDLRADAGPRRLAATVFVECGSAYRSDGPEAMRPVGETEWVASVAGGLVAGIVGFADLTLGDRVDEVLEAHLAVGEGKFRGIRHVSAWDGSPAIRASHTQPPPHLLEDAEFQKGFAALGRAGLSFDAYLYSAQLPELAALARAHPDVPIILDHIGGPLGIGPYAGRRAEVLERWRHAMRAVAACPNVVVKLGGIGMPIYGMDWHKRAEQPASEEVAAVWGPEIRWVLEAFGVERCMFESNFPVDRASFSYQVCWNAFIRMTHDLGAADRAALFRENAMRIYRLGATEP